jgi:hypothetical protein
LHGEHNATFDTVEYCPAAHAVQLLAPLPVPVFVREPALQAMQLVWPVLSWYLAAAHGAHAIVEAVLDWPAAQTVQLDAPTLASVLVYEPALQLEHAATFDAVEYCPAAHAVQLLAPLPVPVFVREPALHAIQLAWPVLSWYLSAAHGAHAIVEAVLDWPAAHAVQLDAPTLASVLVYDPAVHVIQVLPPVLARYFPAAHDAHAAVDTVLNLPDAHAVQVLAPVPANVFVTAPALHAMHEAVVPAPADAYEAAGHAPLHAAAVPWPLSAYRPALQLEHAATFDAVEYCPAAHTMQLLAPLPVPVFVREPALHAMQLVWPVLSWYLAAAHGAHAIVAEAALNWPTAQGVQLVALAYCPAVQAVHVCEPAPAAALSW